MRTLILALLSALFLVACGGGGSEPIDAFTATAADNTRINAEAYQSMHYSTLGSYALTVEGDAAASVSCQGGSGYGLAVLSKGDDVVTLRCSSSQAQACTVVPNGTPSLPCNPALGPITPIPNIH